MTTIPRPRGALEVQHAQATLSLRERTPVETAQLGAAGHLQSPTLISTGATKEASDLKPEKQQSDQVKLIERPG